VYLNAGKKCQLCGKTLELHEMQVGHKKAWSRGGKTNFKNCVCLCYGCNNLMGNDNLETYLKKRGIKDPALEASSEAKGSLESLSLSQLKDLAKKHNIKLKSTVEEGLFDTTVKAPSKKQYINKLSKVVTKEQIAAEQRAEPKVTKKRHHRREPGLFDF
jgi:hypothetical protein